MKDPRDAITLGEACHNGDGTYNLPKMLSWLSKCTSKSGNGMSVEEVQNLIREIKDRKRK